jgi:hypothetical protein
VLKMPQQQYISFLREVEGCFIQDITYVKQRKASLAVDTVCSGYGRFYGIMPSEMSLPKYFVEICA